MLKETARGALAEPEGIFDAPPADRDAAYDKASQRPAAAAGRPVEVAVLTLGCKVNQYESAVMVECLTRAGYRLVDPHGVADCYIINTCTVTGGADYQSRQLIRRVQRVNPQAAVIITGCYAQTAPQIFARMPGVAAVAGTREKSRMAEIVAAARQKTRDKTETSAGQWMRAAANGAIKEKNWNRPGAASAPVMQVAPIDARGEADIPPVNRFPGHTRAFLKIQDGCDAFCSYCIVPYARGRSRSIGAAEVIRRIENLARRGYREVVLTGIHLGVYGEDRRDGSTLAGILRHVEDYGPVERLRLSSLEPREITDEILTIMSAARIVCPHLHIPLQSGDDGILAKMGRNYDRDFFQTLLEKVVSARPDMTVGMDVIAGFPGEDEEAFENTVEMAAAAPIAYLHVFPYSRRPGTAAARMGDQIREGEKKRRCRLLRDLGAGKRRRHMERFVGAVLPVLVEAREKRDGGRLRGLSHNYLSVVFEAGSAVTTNSIVPVKLVAPADDRSLWGAPVHG